MAGDSWYTADDWKIFDKYHLPAALVDPVAVVQLLSPSPHPVLTWSATSGRGTLR